MAQRRTPPRDYFICPHCGAELPQDAVFCRHCGASEESGWNDQAGEEFASDDEDFDYDEFLRREFPEQAPADHSQVRRRFWTTLLVALLCLAWLIWAIFP